MPQICILHLIYKPWGTPILRHPQIHQPKCGFATVNNHKLHGLGKFNGTSPSKFKYHTCYKQFLLWMFSFLSKSKNKSQARFVCMHACMHVCMHACMYVCMYVCVCVCGCMRVGVYVSPIWKLLESLQTYIAQTHAAPSKIGSSTSAHRVLQMACACLKIFDNIHNIGICMERGKRERERDFLRMIPALTQYPDIAFDINYIYICM